MKHNILKAIALVLPLAFGGALFAAGGSGAAPEPVQDKAKELFELTCGGCHGSDLVQPSNNTREQWAELVQSMVDKGAYLKKEDFPIIVDYITATFSLKKQAPPAKETPAPAPAQGASANDAAFEKFLVETCASCHDYQMVAEKQGSKDDWDSTVRRMVDRGATMEPDQIVKAVDYFAKKYPVK